jgi:hypothetical protein
VSPDRRDARILEAAQQRVVDAQAVAKESMRGHETMNVLLSRTEQRAAIAPGVPRPIHLECL